MIDTTEAKADAEEGLRIAESATGGKWRSTWDDPHHEDFGESSAVTTDLDGAPLRGMVVGVMWYDGLHVACRRENAEFISDSRTRAPQAYRNVIALAEENERLNRRLGEAGELYGMALFDNERLTKERDELRSEKAARETERKSLLDAAAEFDRERRVEIERLRAEVERLTPLDDAVRRQRERDEAIEQGSR